MFAGGPRPEGGAAGEEASPRAGSGGAADTAAGSVGGRLGQTGRLGLATHRSAGEERGGRGATLTSARAALPAIEADPQAGGTARPNTGP